MKAKLIVLVFALTAAAISIASSGDIFAQKGQVQPPKQQPQARPAPAKRAPLSRTQLLADLAVRGMCVGEAEAVDHHKYSYLQVTVANIGNADADPCALKISCILKDGKDAILADPKDETGDIYQVPALQAGEKASWQFFDLPLSTAAKIRVVIDPTYSIFNEACGVGCRPTDPNFYVVVKAKIPESNKKNNELTLDRAQIPPCGSWGIRTKRIFK